MIITKARLSRTAGTQGSLAKFLLAGAVRDRNHGLIWSLFSRPDEANRDFLFREIEPGAFIIVAKRPPDDPHRLWLIDPPKVYEPQLQSGDRLGFVLRANPAMAVRKPGKLRGMRVDAIMHAKFKLAPEDRREFRADEVKRVALDWLFKRADNLGADFDADRCDATGYSQVCIPRIKADRKQPSGGQSDKTIEYSEIDFSGRLTVTDPAKLKAALFNGIGKARAYGCGLMMVRRLQD
jgi:CRISPR system Cascade subunit CasE